MFFFKFVAKMCAPVEITRDGLLYNIVYIKYGSVLYRYKYFLKIRMINNFIGYCPFCS